MSTNKLTSIVRRGTMLGAAFAIIASAFAPAASTFADSLNPLTDRSLTLSSSAPGWDDKDGSGNTLYAPPNSGANGRQSGNTFAFKVSTNSTDTGPGATSLPITGMTFQYCTTPAGLCRAPGDNLAHAANSATTIAAETSDLEVVTSDPTEVAPGAFGTYVDAATGAVKAIPTAANFVVYYMTSDNGTPTVFDDDTWAPSSGWVMTTKEEQNSDTTGKDNQINLVNEDGQGFAAGTSVKVVFFATGTNYITNPGSGAFFVKINTYHTVDNDDAEAPAFDLDNVIDGGVTVANVMNLSIQITTKVLETMEFSVGTVDPNTLSNAQLATATGVPGAAHTPCGRILMGMDPDDAKNTLSMGDQDGEFSLSTERTYSTHSYWRLSSNSSAGATVYYSGNTLSNTVGDKIEANGEEADVPALGAEQFGIAMANGTGADLDAPNSVGYKVNYKTETAAGKLYEYGADDNAAGLAAYRANIAANLVDAGANPITTTGLDASMFTGTPAAADNASYHFPQLYPLVPQAEYAAGAGNVNSDYGTIDTAFAFDETSQQIPVALATQSDQVVDCVTAKMRYIANIAATTPAGIYTTKVNYIAAPQY